MNKQPISMQKILTNIVGLKVNAVRPGIGSLISLDIEGGWCLWVYMCAWRIDKDGKPYVASFDEHETTTSLVQIVAGTTITGYMILNAALDTVFSFETNITLTLFNTNTRDTTQWMLFTPDDAHVLSIGPADRWDYGQSNAPRGDI